MLVDETKEDLNIDHGLEILVDRCLISKNTNGEIVMHKLLQQVATKVLREEPWKHMILIDASEISDVLERAKGTRAVSGISYDISDIDAVSISERAFKRMPNLQFLKFYKSKVDGNDVLHVPKELELPHLLRLLDWKAYPFKCLLPTFQLDNLVELNLQYSKLEYLWEGTKVLMKLKNIDVSESYNLKELPDLSCCPNLEKLNLNRCDSLVQLPSSMGSLHKLEVLETAFCRNLEYVPLFKLASLKTVFMWGCSKLRKIPDISKEIRSLSIGDTMLEEVPDSLRHWSGLERLHICGSVVPYSSKFDYEGLKKITDLGGAKRDIEKIPDWIKGLQGLEELLIIGCPKLASFSEFPVSLTGLVVMSCESLATVSIPSSCEIGLLFFYNCLNLSQEAQREIAYHSPHSSYVCFPGKTMPEDFDHRAIGNSLTIQSDCKVFRICVVLSPTLKITKDEPTILYRIHINGVLIEKDAEYTIPILSTEHLYMCPLNLFFKDGWREQDNEIVFKFSTTSQEYDILECGVKILTDESTSSEGGYESGSSHESISSEGGYESGSEQVFDGSNEFDEACEGLKDLASDLLNIIFDEACEGLKDLTSDLLNIFERVKS